MSAQLKRYEFRGEYDMIHLAEVATGESLSESYDIEWVRADEAAAALSEAHATIARLEALLREAVDTLDDGWGTEQVTKEAAEAYFELMPRLKAALSPREGEG